MSQVMSYDFVSLHLMTWGGSSECHRPVQDDVMFASDGTPPMGTNSFPLVPIVGANRYFHEFSIVFLLDILTDGDLGKAQHHI